MFELDTGESGFKTVILKKLHSVGENDEFKKIAEVVDGRQMQRAKEIIDKAIAELKKKLAPK